MSDLSGLGAFAQGVAGGINAGTQDYAGLAVKGMEMDKQAKALELQKDMAMITANNDIIKSKSPTAVKLNAYNNMGKIMEKYGYSMPDVTDAQMLDSSWAKTIAGYGTTYLDNVKSGKMSAAEALHEYVDSISTDPSLISQWSEAGAPIEALIKHHTDLTTSQNKKYAGVVSGTIIKNYGVGDKDPNALQGLMGGNAPEGATPEEIANFVKIKNHYPEAFAAGVKDAITQLEGVKKIEGDTQFNTWMQQPEKRADITAYNQSKVRPEKPDKEPKQTWIYQGTNEEGKPVYYNSSDPTQTHVGDSKILAKPTGKRPGTASALLFGATGIPQVPTTKSLVPDGKGGFIYK